MGKTSTRVGTGADMLRRALQWRGFPFWVAVVAFIIALPTAWSGWALDDYLLRMVMLGQPYANYQPMDLFGIPNGDPETITRYRDQGIIPFWAPQEFRIVFFRPLTVVTAWVDFQLWPDSPILMHLHSLLWFFALVLVAGLLYRSLEGVFWISGLAALLNGLDPVRALPVAWISNRHVLISSFFGVLTLLMYHKWRSTEWRPGSILAPCALALALLAGEMALAAVCYLIAYALFLDTADRRSRVLALAPCMCVSLAWVLAYVASGSGSAGSGTYMDPRHDLPGFLASLVLHGPLLLLAEVTSIPADLLSFVQAPFSFIALPAGLLLVVLVLFLFLPMLRASAVARFWGAGLMLSLIPVASTLPSGRLLSFVALGAAGLLARFTVGLASGEEWIPRSVSSRRIVVRLVFWFLVVKLVAAPLMIPFTGLSLHSINDAMLAAIRTIPDGGRVAGQDVVILNPPDHLYYASYVFAVKKLEGKTTPRRLRVLAAGPTEMVVFRVDTSTIQVKTPDGLYAGPFGRSFRSRNMPLKRGESIGVEGLESTVQEANSEGDPTEMVHRFSWPLEDGHLRLLRWENGKGYVPFVPPAVGGTTTLPPSTMEVGVF